MTSGASNGHIDDLSIQYIKKIYKKAEKQNGPSKLLVWRTGMTALMILDELYGIPFEKLEASLYFIGSDLNTKKLTRKYESILELAGISADKFINSLHRELNELSIFIKSNNMLPELFEMISLCDKLRYKYHKDNAQIIHIMNAYQNIEYCQNSKHSAFSPIFCLYSSVSVLM